MQTHIGYIQKLKEEFKPGKDSCDKRRRVCSIGCGESLPFAKITI